MTIRLFCIVININGTFSLSRLSLGWFIDWNYDF